MRTESLCWQQHKSEERQKKKRESGRQRDEGWLCIFCLFITLEQVKCRQQVGSGSVGLSHPRGGVCICTNTLRHKLPLTWSHITRNCMEDQGEHIKANRGSQITTGLPAHFPSCQYGCMFVFVTCLKEHHTELRYLISITLLNQWSWMWPRAEVWIFLPLCVSLLVQKQSLWGHFSRFIRLTRTVWSFMLALKFNVGVGSGIYPWCLTVCVYVCTCMQNQSDSCSYRGFMMLVSHWNPAARLRLSWRPRSVSTHAALPLRSSGHNGIKLHTRLSALANNKLGHTQTDCKKKKAHDYRH